MDFVQLLIKNKTTKFFLFIRPFSVKWWDSHWAQVFVNKGDKECVPGMYKDLLHLNTKTINSVGKWIKNITIYIRRCKNGHLA